MTCTSCITLGIRRRNKTKIFSTTALCSSYIKRWDEHLHKHSPSKRTVLLLSTYLLTNRQHSNSWEKSDRSSQQINFTPILQVSSLQILKNSKTITLHYAQNEALKKPQESQEGSCGRVRTNLFNSQIPLACLLWILIGSINLLWKCGFTCSCKQTYKGFADLHLIMDWTFASVNIWLWWRQTIDGLQSIPGQLLSWCKVVQRKTSSMRNMKIFSSFSDSLSGF